MTQETCSYPSCHCPFDAPADPNWCARRLPKAARSPAALSPVADLCQVQCAGVASELKRFRLGIFMGTVGMFEAADGEYVKFADLHAQMDSADGVTKALRAAATSLETIADLSGRKTFGNPPIATFMDTFSDVRLYAAARARVAREVLNAAAPSRGRGPGQPICDGCHGPGKRRSCSWCADTHARGAKGGGDAQA